MIAVHLPLDLARVGQGLTADPCSGTHANQLLQVVSGSGLELYVTLLKTHWVGVVSADSG